MNIEPITKKIIGIALVILGIISLVGAIFAVTILAEFGTALGSIEQSPELNELGLGVAEIAQTFMFIITLGWIWLIVVIIITLITLYFGIQMIRGKI